MFYFNSYTFRLKFKTIKNLLKYQPKLKHENKTRNSKTFKSYFKNRKGPVTKIDNKE